MILFFDTETTGFPRRHLDPDHSSQPHLVQLAAQLCTPEGSVIGEFCLIVNPEVPIPTEASAIHGITTEKAQEFGVTTRGALNLFTHLLSRANTLVAHNIAFDVNILEIASYRCSMTLPRRPTFCTMEAATPIIDLPPSEAMLAAGFNRRKPPKLEECIKHFFGETLEGAHDAMVDVRACKRVFFHIKGLL